MNMFVTGEYLDKHHPDMVVLATGAVQNKIPGCVSNEQVSVVMGNDVIMEKVSVGEKIVVIGGGPIGLEVAVTLPVRERKFLLLI